MSNLEDIFNPSGVRIIMEQYKRHEIFRLGRLSCRFSCIKNDERPVQLVISLVRRKAHPKILRHGVSGFSVGLKARRKYGVVDQRSSFTSISLIYLISKI